MVVPKIFPLMCLKLAQKYFLRYITKCLVNDHHTNLTISLVRNIKRDILGVTSRKEVLENGFQNVTVIAFRTI